ncbi:unnamed protein product [Chrysoparadoxa australica]
MEDQAGLAKDQQSVLFKGKLLSADDDLAEAGISEGDTVNIVPSKKPRAAGAGESGPMPSSLRCKAAVTAEEGASDPFGLGGLGGPGGMPGMEGMPDMTPENYQKMMNDMMNSPMMDEFLSDPEKIEESRQAILENPQLRQAMEQLPGFSDMIDDADKWRESMMMAKDVMQAQKEMISKSQETTDVDDLD